MTVKELIAELSKHPGDEIVHTYGDDGEALEVAEVFYDDEQVGKQSRVLVIY